MQYNYLVNPGEAINLWQMQELQEVPYTSPVATFDHEDQYRIIATEAIDMKTIAKIVYPVREAFLKDDTITDAPYVDEGFEELYFPWANRKVDFSTFSHDPKVMSNYVRCYIYSDTARNVTFDVKTCGGVKVWMNGQVELLYKSYERNVSNTRGFTVNLVEGENELLLYANDLAERDVFFYFELVNRSEGCLEVRVPIDQEQSRIDEAKQVMESIYFEKDTFVSEKVVIKYDNTIMHQNLTLLWGDQEHEIILDQGQDSCILGDGSDANDPYFKESSSGYFPIKMIVDGLKIQTTLYLASYNHQLTSIVPEATIELRKVQGIKTILEQGNPGDLGTALAELAGEGKCSDVSAMTIETHLKRIEDRLDCADFRLPVILLMTMNYEGLLPLALNERIKKAALNFRYWCDEPGNDVMWFFSENHALLFHVSQYLSGHYYKNEIFTNSGRTSQEQKQIGYDKIVRWFNEFLPRGYDEWNSLTYLPIDAIAFFTLYQVAPDQVIKDYAKKALDITFEIIAANMHNNVFTSSYGRAYEHTLKGLELGELSMYAWLAWGQGKVSVKNSAVTLFATSDYVPASYDDLRDLTGNQVLTIERVQGSQDTYTYMHKRRDYALGTAMKFHPFKTGMQQHFINLSFSESEIPMWFNHPGELVFSGSNRPSYWGGWQTMPYVEQYKSTVIAGIRMKDTDEVDYIHANIPFSALDCYETVGNWLVFAKGDAYGAFWFANGFELVTYGANTMKEVISRGRENGLIIKCATVDTFKSFEAFKAEVIKSQVDFISPEKMIYTDYEYGIFETDLKLGLHLDGQIVERNATRTATVTYE